VSGALRLPAWAVAFAVLTLAVLPFAASAASAPDFPKLTGRVVDDAGILSEVTEKQITDWLAGLERDTGKQLVVATVRSLGGRPIEDYGYQLGRHWGIGEKRKNTGAILLVAPSEREVRIEVGYGLEGELTDATSRTIIERHIVPAFKRGDMNGGVINGTAAILKTLGWRGGPPVPEPPSDEAPSGLGSLLFFGLILLFFLLRGVFMRRRRPPGLWGTRSRGPWDGFGWGGGLGGWGGGGGAGGGFGGGGGSFGGGGASGRW
jgi:uncharacterized protein